MIVYSVTPIPIVTLIDQVQTTILINSYKHMITLSCYAYINFHLGYQISNNNMLQF